MLKVYEGNERAFNHNGIKIVRPLEAIIRNSDSEEYYLYLRCAKEYKQFIIKNRIITSSSPWGIQPFRIGDIQLTDSEIIVRCDHVFYDSKNYIVTECNVENMTINSAGNLALEHVDTISPFRFMSDINIRITDDYSNRSLYEVWVELNKRCGGHLAINGFNVQIKKEIGSDKGCTILYGKNLINSESVEDWSEVCTKVFPIGRDDLMIPEKFIKSDVDYEIPYSKVVEFTANESIDSKDEAALIEDLRNQAKMYIEAKKYPKVHYSINALIPQNSNIGDTLQVKNISSGIDLKTQVIAMEYDCLTERIVQFEFGNFKKSTKDVFDSITSKIEDTTQKVDYVKSDLEKAKEDVSSTINSLYKSGFIYLTDNEIYFLDALPKEAANNCLRINLGGIGFSKVGWQGPYETAWSIDGVFYANWITAGVMSGDRILANSLTARHLTVNAVSELREGLASSLEVTPSAILMKVNSGLSENGSISTSSFTLSNGTADFKNLNFRISDSANNQLLGVDRSGNLTLVGSIKSESGLYKTVIENGAYESYYDDDLRVRIGRGNASGSRYELEFYGDMSSNATGVIYSGETSSLKRLNIKGKNRLELGVMDGDPMLFINTSGVTIWADTDFGDSDISNIRNATVSNRLTVGGDIIGGDNANFYTLDVDRVITCNSISDADGSEFGGTTWFWNIVADNMIKGPIIDTNARSMMTTSMTRSAGEQTSFSYNLTNCYMGEIGEGTIRNGECLISLSTNLQSQKDDASYQVFLQAYGQGEVYVESRMDTYFIVKGDEYLSFGWEIKALKKG